MAVDLKALKNHPGRNPDYEKGLARRKSVQAHNRDAMTFVPIKVPPLPNKYVPHTGAKQAAKIAKQIKGERYV